MSSLQERLGFAATDRLLIVHADDIGMCEATVSAWRELHGQSAMTSASAMATCPWFPAAVKAVQEAGESADMGLHLVLNCEWRAGYRWGPITGTDTPAKLCAEDGYFYPLAADTYANADLAHSQIELAAQLKRARTLGLPLTHIDCHMMTALHPDVVGHMLQLGHSANLPILVPRYSDASLLAKESTMPLDWCERTSAQLKTAAEAGQLNPIDAWAVLPFGQYLGADERLHWASMVLQHYFTAPGVYALIGHPANDGTELRAIAPDWPTRVADRDLFANPDFRAVIEREGFKLIGMKALAQLHN
ncbi:ChbG/HpnK family deacetylase [Chitinibacter bivalviorum]|uniref:ChbG/HpnK family deacetylase n=1 Tax=Chitinibacter bivalviorum TaxID=2739434 RepID=A0A7H9BE16_9NEIS|nr:ChbG/HpnK family deacetylase [Chitinibacter bivalviorum]QLG86960.1 ChbG/HpnK family deacetylase [Chitinibacter bivalviorum]